MSPRSSVASTHRRVGRRHSLTIPGESDVATVESPNGGGETTHDENTHDEGSALVEAVVVIAVLLLPLLWVATALIRVEAGSYAARMAARESARTYVTASSTAQGAARAEVAARIAFEDQATPRGAVAISCTRQPCLTPGGEVRARAATTVGLPFVPSWLSGPAGLQITLSSEHVEKVEQYGGRR